MADTRVPPDRGGDNPLHVIVGLEPGLLRISPDRTAMQSEMEVIHDRLDAHDRALAAIADLILLPEPPPPP